MIFANHSEDNEIFPLRVTEIARAQSEDKLLKIYFTNNSPNDYTTQIYKDTEVICKDGKIVIPKKLQQRAVMWYHHYLQHPGQTRIEETL